MYKAIRKVIALIVVLMTVATIPTAVCASESPKFSVSGAMIVKYYGDEDVVTVPAIIDGVAIAGIDSNAFSDKNMHTVIIEEGIEVIQPKAFIGCKNLEYVKSPESMLLINADAFFECSVTFKIDASDETYIMDEEPVISFFTETDVETYNGFTYSGSSITGYTGDDTAITIPDAINGVKITTIGANAFLDNTTITSVTIPDTITTIGGYAFKGCISLAEVTLSNKLSSAGVEAFMNCSSLKQITIPGTLKRVAKSMFYGCSNLTDVVLNSGVTSIAPYAFYNCVKLKNTSIPDSITKLETWCFGYCKELESFHIPNKCTFVDSAVFYYCNSLNNVHFPDTVTTMGTHCFRECWALTDIKLSKAVKSIQLRAFHNCPFTEIEIPNSVTSIGKEAFYQCANLVNIEIPETVTTIGAGAFYGCTRLQKMIIYGTETTLTTIFTFDNQTSMGANTVLYVVKGSAPEQYAKDSQTPYVSLNGTANVIDIYCSLNGSKHEADRRTALAKDDTVSIKYTVVNVGSKAQDLCLLVCLYDNNGDFLKYSHTPDKVEVNSLKEIEVSITAEEACYAKVMLWEDMDNVIPLCPINEI